MISNITDGKYVDICLAKVYVSLFQKTYVICKDIALKALKRYINDRLYFFYQKISVIGVFAEYTHK